MVIPLLNKFEPDWHEKINQLIQANNAKIYGDNLLSDGCFECNSLNKKIIGTELEYTYDVWMTKATYKSVILDRNDSTNSAIDFFDFTALEEFEELTGSPAGCIANPGTTTTKVTLIQIVDTDNDYPKIKKDNLRNQKVTFAVNVGNLAKCAVLAKIVTNDGDILAEKHFEPTSGVTRDSITAEIPNAFNNLRVQLEISIPGGQYVLLNECKMEINESATAFIKTKKSEVVADVNSIFETIEKHYGTRTMTNMFFEVINHSCYMRSNAPLGTVYPLLNGGDAVKTDEYGRRYYDYVLSRDYANRIAYSSSADAANASAVKYTDNAAGCTSGADTTYVGAFVSSGTYYSVEFKLVLDCRPYL